MTKPHLLWYSIANFLSASVSAEAPRWFTSQDNVVIDGFDAVAYFTEDRAVRGKAEFALEHGGATFYFSTAANRDAFKKSPEKYAPQFGGFCAIGVATNHAKVPSDPRTFKIYNGELLLFFNDLYQGQPVNTKSFGTGMSRNTTPKLRASGRG